MENHRINIVGISDEENCLLHYVYHWYLQRGPISDILPKFKVDETLQSFCTSGALCVPKFSFLQYIRELDGKFMEKITFNHPTVLIKLRPKDINNDPVMSDLYKKSEPLKAAAKNRFRRLSNFGEDIFSYFEGFHIGRYNSDVKIIVTDWSDPRSEMPDMNDPKFPIKSVLYLATSVGNFLAKIRRIEKLLKNSKVKPLSSGGVLKLLYEWSYDSEDVEFLDENNESATMYYVPKRDESKESSIITIAFAGEEVKSAALDIMFTSDFGEELEEFKRGLDFPTDDDQVIGFILERWSDLSDSSYPRRVTSKIHSLFPSVRTSTIGIEFRSHLPEASAPDLTLHLIRI